MLKTAKTKAFRDNFLDFVRELERKGKAGSYIARFKKVIRSWLSFNGLDVKLKINIAREYETPRIADERVPSKEELDKILRMASTRARVSIALMAFSGLRPQSLGNYDGTDGLKIGDFIEAEIKADSIKFQKIPAILVIRKGLSKVRHQYFTFVPQQTLTYIQDYLQKRVKTGEKLSKNSPLLGFDPRGFRKNSFLRTNLVTRDIRETILKAGFNWRPYVLRAYFDTNMIIAESKGKISHPYLQFMMGHKGDIEARYSTNKGILPPDMIEDMRKCYRECMNIFAEKARARERIPVIFDTDIGSDIDDTWALIMLLKSPELDPKLIITENGDTTYRAKIVAKILERAGRTDIPIGIGIRTSDKAGPQLAWVEDYNITRYPGIVHKDGIKYLIETIMNSSEPITLICTGPLTNIAAALEIEPRIARKVKFVGMLGCLRKSPLGYGGGKGGIVAEYNVLADPKAAQKVFSAPWRDMTITPLDTCGFVKLKGEKYRMIRECGDPLIQDLMENYKIWLKSRGGDWLEIYETQSSILFDTVAIYLAFSDELLVMEDLGVRITDDGYTIIDEKARTVHCAVDWKDLSAFEDLIVERLTQTHA